MKGKIFGTILVLFVALFAAAGSAQQEGQNMVDLSGTWDLQATVFLLQEGNGQTPCEFAGTSVISQNGSDLTGTSDLNLTSGPNGCPSEMSATLTGVNTGGDIEMGVLMGGQLGTADFTGSAGVEGLGAGGNVDVTSGPFTGVNGFWSAALVAGPPVITVPTLTGVGLTLLVLLLFVAGAFFLRRQQQLNTA